MLRQKSLKVNGIQKSNCWFIKSRLFFSSLLVCTSQSSLAKLLRPEISYYHPLGKHFCNYFCVGIAQYIKSFVASISSMHLFISPFFISRYQFMPSIWLVPPNKWLPPLNRQRPISDIGPIQDIYVRIFHYGFTSLDILTTPVNHLLN